MVTFGSSIPKNKVYSDKDLKTYLRQKALSYDRLYHFTTYESLIAILTNRSFRLSRMDLLNDKAEQSLGFHGKSFQNYIMSFTQKKEYVSMWAMYGKASGIKLRLDFSNEIFNKTAPELFLDSENRERITLRSQYDLWGNYESDVIISDVAYIDKEKREIKHNTRPFKDVFVDENLVNDLAGIIKYDAWEFEKETRFKAQLDSAYLNEDYGFPKYIYLGIDDSLIKSFHITFNPWMSDFVKNEVKNSLNRLAGFELSYDNSDDDGEISEL